MHQALQLVLHATLYSTCSIVLYCVAGYTSIGLFYSLIAIANLLFTIGYPFIRCLKRYPVLDRFGPFAEEINQAKAPNVDTATLFPCELHKSTWSTGHSTPHRVITRWYTREGKSTADAPTSPPDHASQSKR